MWHTHVKSVKVVLPALPPGPDWTDAGCSTPHEKEMTSVSCSCPLIGDSPVAPLTFMNRDVAISSSPWRQIA
jgi:hypothetical protein